MTDYPISEEDILHFAKMVELMPKTETKEEFFVFIDANREQCREFFMFLYRLIKKIKEYVEANPLSIFIDPQLGIVHRNSSAIATAFGIGFAELGIEPTDEEWQEMFGMVSSEN